MATEGGPAGARREKEVPEPSTDLDRGLTGAEVAARLKQYGYNEVREKRASPVLRFLKKFWGLSAWMLELIVILSALLRKYTDLYVVSALLIVNAVLSFIQEQRAAGVVETLRQRLRVSARVLREGEWRVIPARELVPGDVVRVRPGDLSPADIRIVTGWLEADQSALTGESMPVPKQPGDVLHSGSVVRRGEATGVVVQTGARTLFGRTTELVQIARPKLHVEEVISRVVRWLFLIVGALLAVALAVSLVRGMPVLELLPLLLVLLLGAVPVALPVMFTVSMAVGARALAKKGVLVTRLSAADDAAAMDILCVDKTGTITQNRLTMAEAIPVNGAAETDVILWGALASQDANQDPIDSALLTAARDRHLDLKAYVPVSFAPFDPQTRRTEAVVRADGREWRVVKGAVAAVAEACGLGGAELEALEARADEAAQRGYRALAVARTGEAGSLQLVGLVTLWDQPRPDSAALIRELRALGVSVKMLTGDGLPIARQIAEQVGLGDNVIRVADLEEVSLRDAAQAAALAEATSGFAEVYPEDKFTVVKSLQARGHVVGMTGDGVNDAPALRQAEVGIAVSSATDVAKGAASVVLTEEGLSGIVDLIKNGRMIYQRIATWIINKISRTILKTAFVVFAYLLTGKLVVSAFAMLVMMFLTDFVKISLSTDRVRWAQQPERWNVPGLVKVAAVLGMLMVVEAFALLYIGFRFFGLRANDQALYTFSFETLFYFAMFSIFAIRERRHFWDSWPSRTLLTAIAIDLVVGTAIATVGLPGMAPLPLPVTLFVLGYACLFSLVVNDTAKLLVIRRAGLC